MIKGFTHYKTFTKSQFWLLSTIIATGIFLRVFHYFDNRSLWEDEVFLASSIIKMNFNELATKPLDYQQRAPIGFLWMVRLGVVFFDKKELSLRLFPFITGIASLFLFVPVASYFLKTNKSIISAIFIAAVAPPVVYHSVEAKQYGIEFFATILSLYFFTKFYQKTSIKDLLLWGLGGGVILWFSFSSLFILAGMATAISLTRLIKKDWKMFFLYLIPFGCWLISFLIQYVFFISRFPEEEWLVQFWRNREAFMPFPPHSIKDLIWPFNQIYSLIRYPLGLSWIELDYKQEHSYLARIIARMPLLPILIGFLGVRELWLKRKQHLLLFAFPIFLALIASSLELYPLRERLTLFLAPIFILFISKGVECLEQYQFPGLVQNGLIILLLLAPLLNSTMEAWNTNLFGNYKKSYQREAMQYLQRNYKHGDVVYVYWNNLPSFLYYQQVYNFSFNTVYGSDVRPVSKDFNNYFLNLSGDFKKIQTGKRLWYAYKPYNSLKLGDIENEPKWYYYNVNAYKKMYDKVSSLGMVKDSFPTENYDTDIKLYLFKLSEQTKNR